MPNIYLALGDSMSIDEYTGVAGGGAAAQLLRRLPGDWRLVDETFDGNIYAPQSPLSPAQSAGLQAANGIIAENVEAVRATLADIHSAFRGHEDEYLCFDIEPSLAGAEVIAGLLFAAFARAS